MKKDSSKDKFGYWQPYLQIFVKLSGWIAIPVLAGVFLGKWLDNKFQTEPWLFLTSVGFAFLISMFGLVVNTLKEYKKIASESTKNKEKPE